MKKVSLYSKSGRSRVTSAPVSYAEPATSAASHSFDSPEKPDFRIRARSFLGRHERVSLVFLSVLLSSFLFFVYSSTKPEVRQYTQRDIDAAVLHSLDKNVLPSPEAKAFQVIQRSVVRVTQVEKNKTNGQVALKGVGTGVVVVDTGIILTNLHVVMGAETVQVQFANGMVSDATVINQQPENDLAVLQARNLPDDLIPATLRSTSDLKIGDRVMAVGFPFGIGPSASSGIVSGLRRQYHSPEGERVLSNLIQFDAAANPGNSGGPLITMDGQVVGIVTAILNPNEQSTFIGIGFAVPIENAASAAGESPF